MRCDIIIPVWNQLEFTKSCIEHIINNTHYPYKLILVDNGSDLATKAYLESLKRSEGLQVELIRNDENLGFVKAVNQGLSISSAPYVCILNNDTIPAPGWLERMIDFAKVHNDVGLINPQCDGHGDMPIEMYAKQLENNKGEYMEMNQCQGFCMLIKREVIDKIGYFDEAFGIGGFDDTDYSMRAHLAGFRCVAIKDAYVYHRLHGSFDRAGDREDWVKRNQKIYYEKWGKHLRVGIAATVSVSNLDIISDVMMLAYGLARKWTWVHIWLNSNSDRKVAMRAFEDALRRNGLAAHQNIRLNLFSLPKSIFKFVILGKLLERTRRRMKDKRFDALISFDDGVTSLISPIAKVVNVKTIKIPSNEERDDWIKKGRELALFIKSSRN